MIAEEITDEEAEGNVLMNGLPAVLFEASVLVTDSDPDPEITDDKAIPADKELLHNGDNDATADDNDVDTANTPVPPFPVPVPDTPEGGKIPAGTDLLLKAEVDDNDVDDDALGPIIVIEELRPGAYDADIDKPNRIDVLDEALPVPMGYMPADRMDL